jgi:NAD(P)-dependent dehydrogenase (short-subunit alcohol dehydrogenase family)
MSLNGKTYLITGAARRIGRIFALQLASFGANILLHYNHSEIEAQKVKDEIERYGVKVWLLQADLADPHQVEDLVPLAFEKTSFDGVINNAAIFEPWTVFNTNLEDWQKTFQINLTAPMIISQAFARFLPLEIKGRIVNIIDWRAFKPGADHFPYTISKAALAALTQSMAIALAPRILVNGLALGAALPPADKPDSQSALQDLPIRRWTEEKELGQTLRFLLDGPEYITGEIIHLDGGRHLV